MGNDTRRGGRGRTAVVALLVTLVAVLAPCTIAARWAHDEVADTDRYVETVAPLADDPAIQAAVTRRVTDEIMSRLPVRDVTESAIAALTGRGLPPRASSGLESLAPTLEEAIAGFVEEHVARLVGSEEFRQAWEAANRAAHARLVAVLSGEGGDLVEVGDGAVRLDLSAVVDAVRERLVEAGFTLAERLPEADSRGPVELTIVESDDLARAQAGFRLLRDVSTILPFVVLALLAAAVAVARSRRRTFVAAMLAVATSMALMGAALDVFRVAYLDALPAGGPPADAAAAVYDALVRFIRQGLRALLVLALAAGFVAWVLGPGTAASGVRRAAGRLPAVVRGRLDTGRVGAFLGTYRGLVRAGVLALTLVGYAMADHPTGASTVALLTGAAVVLLVTELLARPPTPPAR